LILSVELEALQYAGKVEARLEGGHSSMQRFMLRQRSSRKLDTQTPLLSPQPKYCLHDMAFCSAIYWRANRTYRSGENFWVCFAGLKIAARSEVDDSSQASVESSLRFLRL
jgi:hypothetical protein